MKIGEETQSILKSWQSINNINVKPGNELCVLNSAKSLLIRAKVKETFPVEFSLIDIGQFVRTIQLFDNPDIDFQDKCAHIKSGDNECNFYYAEKAFVNHLDKFPDFGDDVLLSFDVTGDIIQKIIAGADTLGLNLLSIHKKDNKIVFGMRDAEESTKNSFSVNVAPYLGTGDFDICVSRDFIDFYGVNKGNDYVFSLLRTAQGNIILHAKNKSVDIEYWIAMNKNSYYDE